MIDSLNEGGKTLMRALTINAEINMLKRKYTMLCKLGWMSCLLVAVLMLGSGCATTPQQTAGTITKKSIRSKAHVARVTGNVAVQGARAAGGAAAGAVGTAVGR